MDVGNQYTPKAIDYKLHAPAFDAYDVLKMECNGLQGKELTAQLHDDHVSESELNKLSLVWLAQKDEQLGRDVTRADLQAPQGSDFENLMASHVQGQYETIQHAHFDPEGGVLLIGSHEKDALTRQDIDKSLETVEKQRQDIDFADQLTSNHGELFTRLSRDHDGVRSINYWDLKEARSTDDYERSRGTHLFTDDERQLIDNMYKHWGRDNLRRIEERDQSDTMGCDGQITMESLAKGTGFLSPKEMSDSFNPPAPSSELDPESARQQAIIENAQREFAARVQGIDQQMHYAVHPGQGFDRIARDVMTRESGTQPSEQDVVNYSQSIANLNGYNRESYDPHKHSIQPGQTLQVHDAAWKETQYVNAVGDIDTNVAAQIDNTNK